MGDSPFQGPSNRAEFRDNAGSSFVDRANGALVATDGPGPGFPLAQSRGFVYDTLSLAQLLMPNAGFDRVFGTDFAPIWEAALSAANTPTIDQRWTGGVVQFNAGGANQVALNPVTPGGATYNPVLGFAGTAFRTRAVPWFARARVYVGAASQAVQPNPTTQSVIFTPAKELVLLSVDGSYVGGPGLTHNIQLVGIGSTHPTQVQLRLQGGSQFAGPTVVSAGPDANMGIYGSRFPINQFFNVALYYDSTRLYWAFSDNYNNPLNVADATLGQLLAMPQDAGAVTVNSSPTGIQDLTIGAGFKIDALAMAYASETGNIP